MLKIRLTKVGRKHEPVYRIIVVDSRNAAKAGKYLEMLGSHNPRLHKTEIKNERVLHWLSKGAQPSDTVHNLLIRRGVVKGKKRNVVSGAKPSVTADSGKPAAGGTAQT